MNYAIITALMTVAVIGPVSEMGVVLDNLFTLISVAFDYSKGPLSTASELVMALVSLAL